MKVVMYHYIRTEDEKYPFFSFLHLNDFQRQLDYFAKTYSIINPTEFYNAISTGSEIDGILLTFDDGLKDHFTFVLPELKKRGLSAIFYISTGVYTGRKLLSVHKLHLLLGKYGGEKIYDCLLRFLTKGMLAEDKIENFDRHCYTDQSNDFYTVSAKKIINYFIKEEYRESLLNMLMSEFFEENEEALINLHYMNIDELTEMKNNGMIIGNHTINHPVMSTLSTIEQEVEIVDSFNFLENLLGKPLFRTFCFPYGGHHSYNIQTVQLLEKHNTLFSFNVEARDIHVTDFMNCPQSLPRYDCNTFPFGKIFKNA